MEQLKNIGQLARQHYEKLVLSVVLILLAAAVWYLYQASQEEREKNRQAPQDVERRAVKLVQPVSLAQFDSVMKQATNPPALSLAGPHNLFNPVKWQQTKAGGPVIKIQTGAEVGANAMQIVRIKPLTFTVAFTRVATSGTGDQATVTGYHLVATNEAAPIRPTKPTDPRLTQSLYLTVNETNKTPVILREVKGDGLKPESLVVELKDFENERVTVTPEKPYTRTVGYEAELKYPLNSKVYPRLRKDSPLDIEGDPYKVVDITSNKVVLSDDSNGKRFTIDQMAPP